MANGVRASIDLIACPWSPAKDEATIRRQYETLLSLGINAFEAGWDHLGIGQWRDGKGIEVVIDRIYNLAAEYGIKVYWYVSGHRIPWKNPDTGETFVGRYKNFPACAGWNYADEPALKNYDHQGCLACMAAIRAIDPNHPIIPVWSADLETARYMFTMHPAWGDLYDVSCTNVYPSARAGENWADQLAYRCYLTYRYTGKSPYWGFEHWQPRDHIAWIQSFVGGNGVMPDIVGQYNVLKNGGAGRNWNGWGDRLKGIGLYTPSAYLFASGADAENIRNQIKDLARLLGWQEEPVTPPVEEPEVITPKTIIHSCGATISYNISSFAENNSSLTCPYCDLALGVEGIKGSETIVEEPPPGFICPECGLPFSSQPELDDHIATVHPPPMPGVGTWYQITCPKCGSGLRYYDNPSLGPKYNIPASCPVCEVDLGVESVRGEVQILERKPWPPVEEPWFLRVAPPVVEISILDRLSRFRDIITPTGSPVQESEMKIQEMIMQLEPVPIMDPSEGPLILAEPEPLKEKILSLDWLKNNWPWVGIGLVGLSLIITVAKD